MKDENRNRLHCNERYKIFYNLNYIIFFKDINLFRLSSNEAIDHRLIRNIKNLYEHNKEDRYKPVIVGHFWSNEYIESEKNGDKNNTVNLRITE